ncbi:MAG: hopanoid C-3 methylase HpnR, partial [Nitrospirota bacterium]
KLQLADHQRPVAHKMSRPPPVQEIVSSKLLYILPPKGRRGRAVDNSTKQVIETTRMGSEA